MSAGSPSSSPPQRRWTFASTNGSCRVTFRSRASSTAASTLPSRGPARATSGWTSACCGPSRYSRSPPQADRRKLSRRASCVCSSTPTSRHGRRGTTTRPSLPQPPVHGSCTSTTAASPAPRSTTAPPDSTHPSSCHRSGTSTDCRRACARVRSSTRARSGAGRSSPEQTMSATASPLSVSTPAVSSNRRRPVPLRPGRSGSPGPTRTEDHFDLATAAPPSAKLARAPKVRAPGRRPAGRARRSR